MEFKGDKYLMLRGDVWQLKMNVPTWLKELKPDAKPYRKSLGTRDVEVARKLRDRHAAKQLAEWDRVRLAAEGIESRRTDRFYGDEEAENKWLELDIKLETMRHGYSRSGFDEDEIDDLILATDEGQALKAGFQKLTGNDRLVDRFLHQARLKPSTKAAYRSALMRTMGKLPSPTSVTPEIAKALFREEAKDRVDSSLRQTKAALVQLWRWLEEEGMPVDELVWAKVKTRGARETMKREPLPDDVLRAMCRALRADTTAVGELTLDAAVVAVHTGARLSEVLFSSYSMNEGLMTVRESKTAAGIRTVPLHEAIWRGRYRQHLERLVEKQGRLRPVDVNLVSKHWGTVRQRLGVPKTMTFHSLRHTVVTKLREAGVAVDRVKAIVGHKDRDITFGHYGRKIDPEVLREEVNRLDVDLG